MRVVRYDVVVTSVTSVIIMNGCGIGAFRNTEHAVVKALESKPSNGAGVGFVYVVVVSTSLITVLKL